MVHRARRTALLAIALLVEGAGCKSKPADPRKTASSPSAELADLSTSLDAVRGAFNARKHEARFLTLLAPT